jgi:hypothetical protein
MRTCLLRQPRREALEAFGVANPQEGRRCRDADGTQALTERDADVRHVFDRCDPSYGIHKFIIPS